MGIVQESLIPSSIPLVTLEVDPGIDDMVALMIMIGAHKLGLIRLLAIICSNGNTDLFQSCENTKIALDRANVHEKEIPLFYGVRNAIYTELNKDLFFGSDGLGNIDETPAKIEPKPRTIYPSDEFSLYLRSKLKYSKRGVTLMSLGSLTFTATVLLQRPDLKVEGIWMMAGNDLNTPVVEWNIHVDPEAAHYVFRSNVSSITLLTFQDCQTVKTPMKWRNYTLGKINTPFVRLLNLAERNRRNAPVWYMFDPILAVSFLDMKAVTEFKEELVQVNLTRSDKSTYGLLEKGPWKIRLVKGLRQNTYQNILERTARACK